jgi:hypothetical protein
VTEYYYLKEGEIVQEGDEVDMCNDGWRDAPKWVEAKNSVGRPAPSPLYPSHRRFRRKIEADQ